MSGASKVKGSKRSALPDKMNLIGSAGDEEVAVPSLSDQKKQRIALTMATLREQSDASTGSANPLQGARSRDVVPGVVGDGGSSDRVVDNAEKSGMWSQGFDDQPPTGDREKRMEWLRNELATMTEADLKQIEWTAQRIAFFTNEMAKLQGVAAVVASRGVRPCASAGGTQPGGYPRCR